MTKRLNKISDFFKKVQPVLNNFFNGKLYPFIIASLVIIGHISGFEFWLNIPIVLSTCMVLFFCESIKPFIPTLFMIVYQVNLKHAPGHPNWSDYYFINGKPIIFIILVVVLLTAIIYYSVKYVFPKISFRNSPILFPIIILSATFVLNGAFSSGWCIAGLLYGLAEVLVFFFLFYFLYHGLEKEKASDIIEYFSYLSLLVAMILVSQVAFAYITYDNLFAPDGSIIRESLMFGWGVQNSVGFALVVIISPLMRGAMKSKYYLIYLFAAGLTWIAAFLTMSRNAWLCSTAVIGISIIIACFCSEKKKFYRIFTLCAASLCIICIVILWNKISPLISGILDVGLSDNGRFKLWKQGIENFLKYPVFGKGFFGYGDTDIYPVVAFLPDMAHNTIVQLLSSMGIVGFLAYIYYRIKTVIPFIKKPTYEKAMLYLVIAATLGASLLDNFIFYFLTAFQYTLALVLIFKLTEEENDGTKEYCVFK